jgi:hypothetical protein
VTNCGSVGSRRFGSTYAASLRATDAILVWAALAQADDSHEAVVVQAESRALHYR